MLISKQNPARFNWNKMDDKRVSFLVPATAANDGCEGSKSGVLQTSTPFVPLKGTPPKTELDGSLFCSKDSNSTFEVSSIKDQASREDVLSESINSTNLNNGFIRSSSNLDSTNTEHSTVDTTASQTETGTKASDSEEHQEDPIKFEDTVPSSTDTASTEDFKAQTVAGSKRKRLTKAEQLSLETLESFGRCSFGSALTKTESFADKLARSNKDKEEKEGTKPQRKKTRLELAKEEAAEVFKDIPFGIKDKTGSLRQSVCANESSSINEDAPVKRMTRLQKAKLEALQSFGGSHFDELFPRKRNQRLKNLIKKMSHHSQYLKAFNTLTS